jgi:hypothetical protein
MIRATFTVAVVLLCGTAAAQQPPVTFESPCECRDSHGKGRWAVKNDPSTPPADVNAIQAVTPSNISSWPGPEVHLAGQSGRTEVENKWFALTGRVVAVKVEADGDLHIALADANGDKPGTVVVEIPAQNQWCEIRKTVFGWTRTRFPLRKVSLVAAHGKARHIAMNCLASRGLAPLPRARSHRTLLDRRNG